MGLHCAVADAGMGYLRSLLMKPDELRVFTPEELSIQDRKEHFRAIAEAIYRRVGKRTYGICNVIRDVVSQGGRIRIHSGTTQVVFTDKNYRRFVDTPESELSLAKNVMAYLGARQRFASSRQKSPLRIWEAKFTGVHIEFEIPPQRLEA